MKNTSILLVVLLLAIAVQAKLFDVKSLLGSTTTPRKETITKGEEATTAASSATTIEDNIKTLKHLRDLVETDIKFHHTSYDRLAYLVDTYGPRMWGGQTLELVIKYLEQMIQADDAGITVSLEPVVDFTKWVRGKESLTLLDPRPYPTPLNVIGLGKSVAGNITAEAIVVTSFDDLIMKQKDVKGKIVVYAVPWVRYGETVMYRTSGAAKAARYGAVASIVRSITPYSIESPHTGNLYYQDFDEQGNPIPKIPAAAISVEDAEMLLRMQQRGQTIRLNLYLENESISGATSYNVVADLKGSVYPEQILVLGGHSDSWDVGSQTGANDDGGGFITCYEALRLLAQSGLKPKRTIRFIAWSGEEYGGTNSGAAQYAYNHRDEMDNHIVAFESDLGSRTPVAWGFTGGKKSTAYFRELLNTYFPSIYNLTRIVEDDGDMTDSQYIGDYGVPMIRNIVDNDTTNDYYYTYHHSAGDTMSIMDPDQMDQNVIAIASLFYLLADADEPLPRD